MVNVARSCSNACSIELFRIHQENSKNVYAFYCVQYFAVGIQPLFDLGVRHHKKTNAITLNFRSTNGKWYGNRSGVFWLSLYLMPPSLGFIAVLPDAPVDNLSLSLRLSLSLSLFLSLSLSLSLSISVFLSLSLHTLLHNSKTLAWDVNGLLKSELVNCA